MARYAVLGLGLMGTAIIYDLLTFDSTCEIFGYDYDKKKQELISKRFNKYKNRLFVANLDINSRKSPENHPLINLLKENNITTVFGAIDYKFNFLLSEICISAGCNYLDLGGNPSIINQQRTLNKKAKEGNITIIPDCGLAPGMVNVIAAHGMNQFDLLDSCHIRVGGLPQTPKTILNYQQVFSIRGLTNEYLEDAIVIRGGNIQRVSSLTEIEKITFPEPWGELEAFQTSGGTSSLPDLYQGKIDELTYKTIRFHGHCQFFSFLKDFGLLSSDPYPNNTSINPREIVEYYLSKKLPQNEPDAVLVRINIKGTKNNRMEHIKYELIDLADQNSGFSAMARTTSFPTSIIGQMITNGVIKKKGVVPHELVVPAKEFKEELAKRNIKFTETHF